MEARGNSENARDVSTPSEIQPKGSSSPRSTILQPEVQSPKPLDGLLGSLGQGLPDVLRRARGFYERHPTLVKAVGTVLLAAMTRRLYRGRRGGWF
jgi:hypothetical protein